MNKKYSCQETFFDKFNELSCYWLGFIAADGNISLDKYQRPNRLTIGLSTKDINHLNKFKNHINYTGNIKTISKLLKTNNKIYSVSTLRISSRKLCQKLFNLGIINNKSLKLKWINIPQKYISHFVRGYFDGDGCISQRTKEPKSPVIVILGTLSFLSKLQNEFKKHTLTKTGSISKRNKIYVLYIHGFPACKAFMEWIYRESSVSLDRKKLKFKSIFNL